MHGKNFRNVERCNPFTQHFCPGKENARLHTAKKKTCTMAVGTVAEYKKRMVWFTFHKSVRREIGGGGHRARRQDSTRVPRSTTATPPLLSASWCPSSSSWSLYTRASATGIGSEIPVDSMIRCWCLPFLAIASTFIFAGGRQKSAWAKRRHPF